MKIIIAILSILLSSQSFAEDAFQFRRASDGVSLGEIDNVGALVLRSTITTTGPIGIGTASPLSKFHVSTINTPQIRLDDTASRTYGFSVISSSFHITDVDASVNRLTLTNTGKVGIGQVNPGSELEIKKDQNDETAIRLNNASTGNEARVMYKLMDGSNQIGYLLGSGSAGTLNNGGAYAMNLFNVQNAPLIFGTNNTERVRILSGGNVGIGTASPSTRLDVRGGVITSSTTSPTITCNAGSPTLASKSTNQHGEFTAGAGASSCDVTFSVAWPQAPVCVATSRDAVRALLTTAGTTILTVVSSGSMGGERINYICMGAP